MLYKLLYDQNNDQKYLFFLIVLQLLHQHGQNKQQKKILLMQFLLKKSRQLNIVKNKLILKGFQQKLQYLDEL